MSFPASSASSASCWLGGRELNETDLFGASVGEARVEGAGVGSVVFPRTRPSHPSRMI